MVELAQAMGEFRNGMLTMVLGAMAWMPSHAQTVDILQAGEISRDPSITEAQRLLGDVKLGHKDAILTCDSAWRFDNGDVEVFGHVQVLQPPATVMTCHYIKLHGEDEWAVAKGDVCVDDAEGSLEAPSLLYSMGSKRARYNQGGVLRRGEWTVVSKHGRFASESEVLELGTDVLATQAGDTLRSDSLHWHQDGGRYVFLGPTTWQSADGGFSCLSGDVVMDDSAGTRKPLGWLAGEVFLEDSTGRLRGDSVVWRQGGSEMWGDVTIEDLEGGAVVLGDHAIRNELDSVDVIHGMPARLRQIDQADTLYLQAKHMTLGRDMLVAHDSVLIEHTAMVGRGDSLVWVESLDQIRLWGDPMMWNDADQLSGDTLRLILEDQAAKTLELRGHAMVLSPANDSLTHSIEGRTLDAHFVDGVLGTVDVLGNGELVHFEVPEGTDTEIRVNRAQCAAITMEFEDKALVGLRLQNSPEGTIAPYVADEGEGMPTLFTAPRIERGEFPQGSRPSD